MLSFKILPLVQVDPDGKQINIDAIKSICSKGLEDCPPEDRAIAWLVLSGVLSEFPQEWSAIREESKKKYLEFASFFGMGDYHKVTIPNRTIHDIYSVEHCDILDMIHADIVRTVRHIVFLPFPSDSQTEERDILNSYQLQMRRIERILYVFSQLNASISYMQGFNELVVPIFFAVSSALQYFYNDWDEVEALVFFCFHNLIVETRMNEFYNTHDQSSIIMRNMTEFEELLAKHKPRISSIVKSLGIHPLCYALKWINLLFSQEYDIPNLVMVWDAIFSHFDRLTDYTLYVALGHISVFESRIDGETFAETMEILQHYSVQNVKEVLSYANQYWHVDFKNSLLVY